MKLTIESGVVVCSLEDKNENFLSACAGAFDGYLNGKLKVRYDDPEKAYKKESAAEWNMYTLYDVIRYAERYGVEVDKSVREYYSHLEQLSTYYNDCKRQAQADKEQQEKWQRLCASGCGKCPHLAYDIDVPICKQTGEILKEKHNVPEEIGGVLHLFNSVAFPSEDCPFNINKIKENKDERISKACTGAVTA